MTKPTPRWSVVLVLATLASQAAASGPQRRAVDPVLSSAFDYLETTEDEFGIDVAVALRIVFELTGDPRAADIARRRIDGMKPEDLRDYGALLEVELPVLPPSPAAVSLLGSHRPQRRDRAVDYDVADCMVESLRCELSPGCRKYVLDARLRERDLTHQGLWVLFSTWLGCAPAGIELTELKHRVAARLVAEMTADPGYSETMLERLAILGHLGFGAQLEQSWIETVLEAQRLEGCWPVESGGGCHPHPTGLALWALSLVTR